MSVSTDGLSLTLVRHGATDWNGAGRWQGWTDTPLGTTGEEQARRLAQRLGGQAFTALYASDLRRAADTARLVRPGESPILDAQLRELNFGKYEGMGTGDVLHDPEYHDWQLDPWRRPAPGGGESLSAVGERLHAWAQELPDGRVLAVSHGAAIRKTAPAPIYPRRPVATATRRSGLGGNR